MNALVHGHESWPPMDVLAEEPSHREMYVRAHPHSSSRSKLAGQADSGG